MKSDEYRYKKIDLMEITHKILESMDGLSLVQVMGIVGAVISSVQIDAYRQGVKLEDINEYFNQMASRTPEILIERIEEENAEA